MAAVALVLCVYLLSVASQGVVGDKVYTVVANQSASSCLSENKTECSLMYYAAHPDQYFREDNTTFHFLPGQHELVDSTLVLMANISNLALYGTDVHEVTVVCSGEDSGGFSFYNITNLTIRELSVSNCSKQSSYYHALVAVDMNQIVNIEMDYVNIRNTAGVGLSLSDIYGNSSINNIKVDFSHSAHRSIGGNFFLYYSRYFRNDTVMMNNIKVSNSFFRNGTNIVYSNSPSTGIAIEINCFANVSIVFDNVVVSGNQAGSGGNILINFGSWSGLWSVSVSILNSHILNGTANSGAGICIFATAGDKGSPGPLESTTTLLNIGNTRFENNTAHYDGGAVYMRLHENTQRNLGRIAFDNCTFKDNKIVHNTSHGGVAVHIVTYTLPRYVQHSMIYFELEFSDCKFLENSALHNSSSSQPRTGALYAENTYSVTLLNCQFIDNDCSGIVGIASNFLMHGENEIRGNTAIKGGGIFFCSGSVMHLYNGTQLNISENNATLSGGGIYVDAECSPAVEFCFFQVDNITADNATLQQTQVYLVNNTADSGSALYGGLIDWCILYDKRGQDYNKSYPSIIFNNTFSITHGKNDLSVVSSDPMYVGFCNVTQFEQRNCPLNTTVVVKPGKTFAVSAVIMGQHHGLVAGVVVAQCIDEDCSISNNEYSQYINTSSILSGRYLTYTVFSREKRNVSLKLVAEDYFSGFPSYQYQPSFVNTFIENCPLGFIEHDKMCSCLKGIPCNITNQTVFRSSPHWIGYRKECGIANSKDIILHSSCPLGYCFDKSVYIHATVDHFYQDVQCAKHRTGLLCGKCKQNYSLGFGSSQCLAGCSTPHSVKSYDETTYTSVWLLDANVHYLHGKHTILFVVACLAGVVALLYALILTFIQCLRRAPNSRMCGWIQRLKPLLDAYTGPYKNKYHFWTGFLLLVRIFLFTAFALNFDNNPILNFTLIITVSTLLISGIQNGIYYNRFIGLLETSVYANLILFSAFSMLSMKSSDGHKTVVVCVFGGWAFLTLVGIILYHGYKNWLKDSLVLGHLQVWFYARLRGSGDPNRAVVQPLIIGRDGNDVSQESDSEFESGEELSDQVTPQLRESLIGSLNS
ncbi:hypothetical protein GBAR_LOCUS14346 [Geodia barretti]|uniref:Uncharacterized protein n=1 Tax=Geodia barretti TaxID=519541 RepID=A0AA35WLF2_GEOBA|nr:hypothetical protein GBAR_LOCUS14346 [Geodia barretti]